MPLTHNINDGQYDSRNLFFSSSIWYFYYDIVIIMFFLCIKCINTYFVAYHQVQIKDQKNIICKINKQNGSSITSKTARDIHLRKSAKSCSTKKEIQRWHDSSCRTAVSDCPFLCLIFFVIILPFLQLAKCLIDT